MLNIEPFGPIISKFDSGNSSLSVIHGDDMKYDVSKKTVTWKLFDKTVTKPLDHIKKVNLVVLETIKKLDML